MKTNKFRYARRCSFTNKPMNEGFCINDGCEYAIDEKTMRAHLKELGLDWDKEQKEWEKNPDNAWFYWTDWDEVDDDCFFDINGAEYSVDELREELLKACISLIDAANENTCCLWEDTLKQTTDAIVLEEISLDFEDHDNEITTRDFKGFATTLDRVEFLTNLLRE